MFAFLAQSAGYSTLLAFASYNTAIIAMVVLLCCFEGLCGYHKAQKPCIKAWRRSTWSVQTSKHLWCNAPVQVVPAYGAKGLVLCFCYHQVPGIRVDPKHENRRTNTMFTVHRLEHLENGQSFVEAEPQL